MGHVARDENHADLRIFAHVGEGVCRASRIASELLMGSARIHRSEYDRASRSSVQAVIHALRLCVRVFDPQTLEMIVGSLLDACLDDRVSPFGSLTAIDTFVNEPLTKLFRVLYQVPRVEVARRVPLILL